MAAALIRFGGISFSHNPKSLKIVGKKNVSSVTLSGGEQKLLDVFDDISTISGTAELYGSGCFSDYEKLLRLRSRNKSEILSVPELGAVRAVLSGLSLNCEPRKDYISVSFEFRCISDEKKAEKIMPYKVYKTKEEESLWDIAYKFGTTVDALAALNPGIRRIDEVEEGKEVRLY